MKNNSEIMKKIMFLGAAMLIAASAMAKVEIPDSVHRTLYLQGGPGIAISGSRTVENMPAPAREFLTKYFGYAQVSACHENFVKETYHVVLSDGTTMTFNHDGKVRDIHMAYNMSIPVAALSAILPEKTVSHLQQAGVLDEVTAIKDAGKNGFGVALLNSIPSEMIFDVDGTFVIVAG